MGTYSDPPRVSVIRSEEVADAGAFQGLVGGGRVIQFDAPLLGLLVRVGQQVAVVPANINGKGGRERL